MGEWAADTWGLEIANPFGPVSPGVLVCLPLPWPLCTPPSSDAGAAAGGPWHSIIKTSVSLMKSYPLLGRGETQVIMNQFSSGQPSARASRGGTQIKARRGRLLSPHRPAFRLAGAPSGRYPSCPQAGTLDQEKPVLWAGSRGTSHMPGQMPTVSPPSPRPVLCCVVS